VRFEDMTSITATYAKNNIGAVWEMAKDEPVEVLSNGTPVAVILSPEQYKSLSGKTRLGRPRQLGKLAKVVEGFDSEAFLNTGIAEVFSEYM
jgi:prevent-host-death family protein